MRQWRAAKIVAQHVTGEGVDLQSAGHLPAEPSSSGFPGHRSKIRDPKTIGEWFVMNDGRQRLDDLGLVEVLEALRADERRRGPRHSKARPKQEQRRTSKRPNYAQRSAGASRT